MSHYNVHLYRIGFWFGLVPIILCLPFIVIAFLAGLVLLIKLELEALVYFTLGVLGFCGLIGCTLTLKSICRNIPIKVYIIRLLWLGRLGAAIVITFLLFYNNKNLFRFDYPFFYLFVLSLIPFITSFYIVRRYQKWVATAHSSPTPR